VNHQIRIPQIRVIDEEGEQLGIMDTRDALDMALERGLDLVEVAPNARPPVCRIMDYGRFRYEADKKAKKAKSKSHQQRVKVIKFRPKTEDHDYQFKKKHIVEFLEAGDRVKVIVQYRGREMAHQERGMRIVTRLLEDLDETALVVDPPRMEGNTLSLMLMPPKK
jgi:translation initiation factor IF-3